MNILVGLQLLVGTSLLAVIEEDCTGGLVTEMFDYSGKVGTDIALLW